MSERVGGVSTVRRLTPGTAVLSVESWNVSSSLTVPDGLRLPKPRISTALPNYAVCFA